MLAFSQIRIGMGTVLKNRRMLAGLTQEKLAEKIGVAYQQLGKYEKGLNSLSVPRLLKAAEALNITPGQFLEEVIRPIQSEPKQDEYNLLRLYQSLTPIRQRTIMEYTKILSRP